jgi:hypothetical protein
VADDDQRVDDLAKLAHGCLPILRGVADVGGLRSDDVLEPALERGDHLVGVVDAQRRLGNIGQRNIGRQIERQHGRHVGDHVNGPIDLSDRSHHFGMALMADQDKRATLLDISSSLVMHLRHQGTGGVEDRQAPARGGFDDGSGDAVGAEHRQGAVRDLVQLFDKNSALGLEVIHHMTVVDDLMANIDGLSGLDQGPIHNTDGAHDASAKSSRLRQ